MTNQNPDPASEEARVPLVELPPAWLPGEDYPPEVREFALGLWKALDGVGRQHVGRSVASRLGRPVIDALEEDWTLLIASDPAQQIVVRIADRVRDLTALDRQKSAISDLFHRLLDTADAVTLAELETSLTDLTPEETP